MGERDLLDILVQEKKIYHLLDEVLVLSGQLAEAVDRGDRVSVLMLVNMRQEPINRLGERERVLREKREALPPADGARLDELLGGAPPREETERLLCAQLSDNRKLLSKTLELDRRISVKMAGSSSVYAAEGQGAGP